MAAVVAIHTLGYSRAGPVASGTAEWWSIFAIATAMAFAVPAFVLVSALLTARSLDRHDRPDWSRFYQRRLLRIVWPFLLWTAVFLALRLAFEPANQPRLGNLELYLLWGRGYYHLYFFSVLIQLALAFPLVMAIVRRAATLGGIAAVAVAIQLGVYASNWAFSELTRSATGYLPYPASAVLWYVPPVLIGAWIGAHWDGWRAIWRQHRVVLAALALVSLGVYLGLEVAWYNGASVISGLHSSSFIAYGTTMALVLLAASSRLAITRAGGPIAAIGRRSLGVFVLHPIVLLALTRLPSGELLASLPLSWLWLWALVLGITWMAVELSHTVGVGRVLFGR